MPPILSSLFDPGAFTIVVAGTLLACAARCGWLAFGRALHAAAGLTRHSFDPEANRRALALALSAIRQDGLYRVNPAMPPDRALALMLKTFLRHGAVEGAQSARRAERARAAARRLNAAQVFATAGDLAPVFGLIGTLFALTQLDAATGSDATRLTVAAMAAAVLSTLYGALLAHLLFFPLASAIERRGIAEEQAREALADWFIAQLPGAASAAQHRRAELRDVA